MGNNFVSQAVKDYGINRYFLTGGSGKLFPCFFFWHKYFHMDSVSAKSEGLDKRTFPVGVDRYICYQCGKKKVSEYAKVKLYA